MKFFLAAGAIALAILVSPAAKAAPGNCGTPVASVDGFGVQSVGGLRCSLGDFVTLLPQQIGSLAVTTDTVFRSVFDTPSSPLVIGGIPVGDLFQRFTWTLNVAIDPQGATYGYKGVEHVQAMATFGGSMLAFGPEQMIDSVGGTGQVVAVPGPAVGAGIPGILAVAGWLLWRRRTGAAA